MPLSKRPLCVHCGNAYGQRSWRSERVTWHGTQDNVPAFDGDGTVIKIVYGGMRHTQKEIADWGDRYPPLRETTLRQPHTKDEIGQHVAHRYIWTGKFIGSAPPFCTLRCAYDYACKAYYDKVHNPS